MKQLMTIALVLIGMMAQAEKNPKKEPHVNCYSTLTYERVGDYNIATLTLVKKDDAGVPYLLIGLNDPSGPRIIYGIRESDTVMTFRLDKHQLKYLTFYGPGGFSIGRHMYEFEHKRRYKGDVRRFKRYLRKQGVDVKSKAVIKRYFI